MTKKKIILLTMLLISLLPLSSGFAVPIMYTVSGQASVFDTDSNTINDYDVSGQIYFNDTVDVTEMLYTATFYNHIPFFSINVGPYNFWGTGTFASHYYYYDNNASFTCPHDGSTLVGEGDWERWEFLDASSTNFYYENGDVYDKGEDYSDFLNVPYRIYSEDLPVFYSEGPSLHFRIFEVIQGSGNPDSSAPVPEPATIILLGCGIAALSARLKLSKK